MYLVLDQLKTLMAVLLKQTKSLLLTSVKQTQFFLNLLYKDGNSYSFYLNFVWNVWNLKYFTVSNKENYHLREMCTIFESITMLLINLAY